nr:immunoglobulin heavy chain junction region [Mus musculus]MBK4185203.1 immunoglobulin heavy chain junction region [Mus musculus]
CARVYYDYLFAYW